MSLQPALPVRGDDARLYIRNRSTYLPSVVRVQTEFARQDLKGTGPGRPRPPVQFAKRALLLEREVVRAIFILFNIGYEQLVLIGAWSR